MSDMMCGYRDMQKLVVTGANVLELSHADKAEKLAHDG